jgi:hypothetical protein
MTAGLLEIDRLAKELRQHAANALASQTACNLSGIVHAFSRAMTTLCEIKPDTTWRNRHPIAVLFATQITHLAQAGDGPDISPYHLATLWCERVAGSEAEAMLEVCLAMNVKQPSELGGSEQ